MGIFKKNSALSKILISFLLTLMMMQLGGLQLYASELEINEDSGQSIVSDDETPDRTPAEEHGTDEDGEQSTNAEEAEYPTQLTIPPISNSIPVGTNEIVVYDESEFKAALADTTYTTIHLGANITMSTAPSSTNVNVAARPGTLVINGVDPTNPKGGKHTYTDYPSNNSYSSLRGACTDITFKDINVCINNGYGIYRSTGSRTTVTFDGVEGKASEFYYGEGPNSTLIVIDSTLTLSTVNGNTWELVSNTGTVRFAGTVAVIRTNATSDNTYFFSLIGSSSTIEIIAGADITLDNSINTSGTNRTVFYGAINLIIGDGAAFTCYSGKAFCTNDTTKVFKNVTIGRGADVRFLHTGPNHLYNSLYGTANSTFTMGPGSNFMLYDNESDGIWGSLSFSKIVLNSPESFIAINADSYVIGYSSAGVSSTLEATGIKSMRYYQKSAISGLFDLDTYTPTDDYKRWWVQEIPFYITVSNWQAYWSLSTVSTDYSIVNMPTGASGAETSLTSANIGLIYYGENQTRCVEIYGSFYKMTYDGNGADSETGARYSAYVYNETVTTPGAENLIRRGYTFFGWNTAADGTGKYYSEGDTFTITKDITFYAQWVQNGYTVSGTLFGGNVGGLTMNYMIDGGSVQTVTIDSSGHYIITGVPHGSTVVIKPPAQTGYIMSPASITLDSITSDSTDNDFTYNNITYPGNYTVVERHVDESTGAAFQDDAYTSLTDTPYSYGGLPDDIKVNGEIYIYKGYKVGSYSPGDIPDGTGTPEISVLIADETIYLIYHKVTSNINVTFPTGESWDFYVNQDTYPYVRTGTMNDNRVYYSFKNDSDRSVYVDLTEVQEISSDGLILVADATASTPGSDEYSLKLIPTSADLPGTANGFTTTVTGITPGTHTTMRLGALDGQYVQQATPTSTNGYVSIGGYYAGYLSATEKNPQLALSFTFSLIS